MELTKPTKPEYTLWPSSTVFTSREDPLLLDNNISFQFVTSINISSVFLHRTFFLFPISISAVIFSWNQLEHNFKAELIIKTTSTLVKSTTNVYKTEHNHFSRNLEWFEAPSSVPCEPPSSVPCLHVRDVQPKHGGGGGLTEAVGRRYHSKPLVPTTLASLGGPP